MPGIVGLISRMPRQAAERELLDMLAAMCHEDFYVTGTAVDEILGVYVGWASRKGSFADKMPAQNEAGTVSLIFAGEDFLPPARVLHWPDAGGNHAAGPSYLVRICEQSSSFPSGLNGRFHGLLVDRARQTATLFNDRYGMERLCYHECKNAFYFAAEAKAILAVRPELRELDARGMGEFIACGAVMENRTLFRGIGILPPGSAWVFRNGAVDRKASYFHPREWEDQEKLDANSYYQELEKAFTTCLPRYFQAREPVAMSLTGGLDTRMIMAWQDCAPGSLPCYTFASMLRENHDVRVARQVAAACGQPFQIIPAGQEFLARFSHYAERAVYLSDGCADVSRSPDVYLNETARRIAAVRMTGNYGGEVLRKVRTFKPVAPLPGLFCRELQPHVRQATETYAQEMSGHPVSAAVFKQGPWNHHGILAIEQSQLSLRTPFWDNEIVRTAFRAPESELASNEASLRLIAAGKRNLLRIPTDRGISGNGRTVSSAFRKGLLEFQFKAEYAYDMGMPQWLARVDDAFSFLRLERLFLGRHKVFHFRLWYRDALAPYLRETLLDPVSLSRPYVEPGGLRRIVEGHVKGNQNYTNEIHKMLTLELLNRLLVDRAVRPGVTSHRREGGVPHPSLS
jgi:asparagine synthase (glutamine-hydrolysing)